MPEIGPEVTPEGDELPVAPPDDVDVDAAAGGDRPARVGGSLRSSRSPSPSCSAGCSTCSPAPRAARGDRRHAAAGPTGARRRRRARRRSAVRPRPPQGQLGGRQLLRPRVRAVRPGAPRAARVQHDASAIGRGRRAGHRRELAGDRAGGRVLRRRRRELAGRLRRRRLDRDGLRRHPGPETWVVDPDGIVHYRTIGTVTADLLGTVTRYAVEPSPRVDQPGGEALAGWLACCWPWSWRRCSPSHRGAATASERGRARDAPRLPGVRR